MPVRFPLPPGSTIGVLGGGQLGRMLALAERLSAWRAALTESVAETVEDPSA